MPVNSEPPIKSIYVKPEDVGTPRNPDHKDGVNYGTHVPEDVGRVKDVEDAHEFANLIAQKGTDLAKAREEELAAGLTQEQRNNLAAIDLLIQKYPQALVLNNDGSPRFYDSSGKPFIVAKNAEGNAYTLVITQDGVGDFIDLDSSNNVRLNPMTSTQISLDEMPLLGDYVSGHSRAIDMRPETSPRLKALHIRSVSGYTLCSGMLSDRYNVESQTGRVKNALTLAQEKHQNDAPPQPKTSFLNEL